MAVVLAVAIALAVAGQARAQQAPGAGRAADPDTGLIAGQIVDAGGAPVPEAMVHLGASAAGSVRVDRRVIADGQGRFFFGDLPAGSYYIDAAKGGYASGAYGRRYPEGPGEAVVLKVAEHRLDASLTVWKFAVIAGTVVDEAGEPLVGVGVRALRRQSAAGRLAFDNHEVQGAFQAVTDDRGQFRLAELLPDAYVLFVPVTSATLPIDTIDSVAEDRVARSALFSSGFTELAGRGQAQTQQIGDVVLITMTRTPTPPAVSTGAMRSYQGTYYPAATRPADAALVSVQSGEERADIVIRMQPVPVVRVSGRLVRADGSPPPPIAIKLVGEQAAGVIGLGLPSGSGLPLAMYDTAVGMSDRTGRFTLLGVPPGEYVLQQGQAFMSTVVAQGTAFWTAQPISVGTSDLDDLVVEVTPAFRVEGRIQLPEATDFASVPRFIAEGPVVFRTASGLPRQFATEERSPRGPGTFASAGAPGGRYVASPLETGGWFVDSVTLDGTDITDRPFDLESDVTSFVVTYTNRPSPVSGSVKRAGGAVDPDTLVVIFPDDETRWKDYGLEPRTLRAIAVSATGAFDIPHMPPGGYFIAALEGEDRNMWRDPAHLRMLTSFATRITVRPHTRSTVSLVSVRAPR
jgi:protocatechuate 3,4-dioxygenase beta subunit